MLNILVEISAVDPKTGLFTTIRMSAANATANGVIVDGKTWLPAVTNDPEFSFSIWGDARRQPVTVSYGQINFNLNRALKNKAWTKLDFDGAEATAWVGEDGADFASYKQIWTGSVGPLVQDSNRTARLALLGPEAALARPLLTRTYAGTGGVEGDAGMIGKFKPMSFGACISVEPVKIDPIRFVYQVDAYRVCQINSVYSAALAFAAPAATVSTYAELIALTLAPGTWAACPNHGLFRLANDPGSAKITADIGSPVTAGAIAAAMAKAAGLSDRRIGASFATTTDAYSSYITEQTDISTAVSEAAFAARRYLIADANGVFHLAAYQSSKTPIRLTSDRSTRPLVRPDTIVQEAPAAPAWKVRIGHTRVFGVHGSGDISEAVAKAAEDLTAARKVADDAFQRADAAGADAARYGALYEAMVADGVLDRAEKRTVIERFEGYTQERNGLIAEGVAQDASPQTANYSAAYDALKSYLETLAPAYDDTSRDTPIERGTFDAKFINYDVARQNLVNALANKAAQTAKYENVENRPTDLKGINAAEGEKLSGIQPNATVGAPVGTEVGGRPVTEVIKDIDDALDAQKDSTGKIITAAQHIAAQKAASDEAKAARNEVAQARSEVAQDVANVRGEVADTNAEVAKVKSDQAAENARLDGEVNAAKSEAASAHADARQGIADAATVASNLTAEVERQKGVEGTINQKIVSVEQKTDNNATAIRDEVTARADADAALASRQTTIETSFKNIPTTFAVIARGYDDPSSEGVREAGLYDAVGNRLHGANRAWNVVTFNADNSVKEYRSYDTWASDNNSRAMAEYLSSLARGTTVVCYTYDEPQNNRKSYGLEPALLDCGAGPAYLSNNFAYRSAYVLIGRKGVGANGGTEAYGSSWVERRFELLKGAANLFDSRALADASARITAEETARASADEAVGRRAAALESRATTLEGQTGGLKSADIVARVSEEETTRARADEAVAARTSTLEAKMNGDQDSVLNARIRDQATAQTNATDALAARFNTVEANYQNASQVDDRATNIANAKVSVEEAARTSADNALASRISTVESSSGGAVGLNPNGDFSQGSNGWAWHPTAIFDFPPLGGGRGYVASTRPGERGELISTKMIRVDDLNGGLRLKAFFRVFVAESFTYLGVQCFDIDAVHMGNIYVEAKNYAPGSYQINALLKGSFDTTLPVYRVHDRLPAGCAYVRVVFFGNYNNVTGTYVQASQVLVEDVGSIQKIDARVTEEVTTLTSANSALANRTSTLEASSRGSGNFISHSDFTSTAGWSMRGNEMGLNNVVTQTGDYWNPIGETVLFLGRSGAAAQGTYSEVVSDLFTVVPNSFIQLYAFVASHRARGWVSVFFSDRTGAWAGYAGENYAPRRDNGGTDLGGWDQVGVKSIKVPSNAVAARFVWRVYQVEGGENPAAWMFRPYVGEAKEGQTDWNPYVAGSARIALNDASARITNEETARVNADSALATRSDTLEAQMKGERESALAARIRDEATARADAVSAVATRTNTLEAKATSAERELAKNFPGFEARSDIWGFDTANWGRNAGDTAWEPDHVKGAGIAFRPGFGDTLYMDPKGWIKTTPGTRYRAGFWVWQWSAPQGYGGAARVYWEGAKKDFSGASSYLGSSATPPEATQPFYAPIPNGAWQCYASDIQVDDAMVGAVDSYWIRPRINIGACPAGAGYVIAGWFFREVTEEFKLNARITAEETARADADVALASRSTTLEAQMNRTVPSEMGRVIGVVDARVAAEETARANADSALATRNSTLEAQMAGTADSGLQKIINNNRNNLIDLSWWKRGAAIPWYFNGGARNEIVEFPHGGNFGGLRMPDGSSGDAWLCQEDSDGNNGGGWDGAPIARLDPDKTYRFVLPIAALDDKTRTSYWGTSGVADLNTANENTNPYFAVYSNLPKERWHLFVGYIFPRNSVGHTHDGAGVWDMETGAKIAHGSCYNFMPDGRQPIHRAYQFYAANGAYQAFGRPVVELVDGSEANLDAALGAKRGVTSANARITAEETARVNADSALATRANALEATVFNGPNQNSTLSSRITNEETARANAVSALAQRSTKLEAYATKTAAINLNPTFSTLPSRDNGAIPTWWQIWASESNVLRNWQTARGIESDWALYDHVTPATANQGLYQDVRAGTGWYVIEATIEVWDGGLAGAGILLYALDTNGAARASATLSFANEPPIGKTPQYITLAGGGATSGVLRYSKLVNLAADDAAVSQYTSSVRIYAMSNWDGFGTGAAYKQMAWHKASLRPATDAEVKGHKALPVAENAQARITAEETARADAVSALANRATSLEATVFNGANQNSTLSSRITNEETARVNAVSALANRASTLEARAGASGNLISNTTVLDYSGWLKGSHAGSYDGDIINLAGDPWHPIGENVYGVREIGRNNASAYFDWLSDLMAVRGGSFYQFYAWIAAHRCNAEVYITWYNADGNIIHYSSSGLVGVLSGGTAQNNWSRVGVPCVRAPDAAAHARFVVRKPATFEGNSDSYLWWFRPFFGEVREAVNEWVGFSHGSGRASVANAYGRITAEENARASADGALASRATSVEARAGSLESRTGINESAIADARNKLASARLELSAVTGGGRAAITLRSDNNAGAGVDIVGDVNFSGNLNVGPDSGQRVKITNSGVTVYDGNGTLRVRLGIF